MEHLLLKVNTVISPSQLFLYAKAPKTAGTSIYRETIEKQISDSFLLAHNPTWTSNEKYFKFTFVRNPWDRLVSNFAYCKKLDYAPIPPDFSDFIRFLENGEGTINLRAHCRPIHDYFLIEGKQWVDYIGCFENLQEDWKYVCSKMTNFSADLPTSNSSSHADYHNYYNDSDIERVYNMYKVEIDYLKYEY